MEIVSQRLDPTVMQLFTGRWHHFHHWNMQAAIQFRRKTDEALERECDTPAQETAEVSCKEVAGMCEAVELAYSDDYEDMEESAQFSLELTDRAGKPYTATYFFPNDDAEDNPRNSF